jgi:hypothetical protein
LSIRSFLSVLLVGIVIAPIAVSRSLDIGHPLITDGVADTRPFQRVRRLPASCELRAHPGLDQHPPHGALVQCDPLRDRQVRVTPPRTDAPPHADGSSAEAMQYGRRSTTPESA